MKKVLALVMALGLVSVFAAEAAKPVAAAKPADAKAAPAKPAAAKK